MKRITILFSFMLVAAMLTACGGIVGIDEQAATPTLTAPSSTPTAFQPAADTATPVVIPPTPTEEPTLAPTEEPTIDLAALVANPPYELAVQQDDNGRNVTTLAGFDLVDFGGNDSACTRTGGMEYIHIGEVVGSESEPCLSVIEWSLKVGDTTVLAGTYALAPGEWFYIPLAVSGQNDSPRIVGTLYILPRGWNAHMIAADLAGDRDARDGTLSIVGLSPTDPWVVDIANALK